MTCALRLALLLLAYFCTVSVSQQTTPDGCYKEYTNSRVNCLAPFLSQTVAVSKDCTGLCIQNAPKCKSAQLVTDSKQCQLYDTALQANKRKKRASGCYGYGPSLMSSPGYNYYVPTGAKYGCTSSSGGETTTSTSSSSTAAATTPTTMLQTDPATTITPSSTSSPAVTTTMTQTVATSTISEQPVPTEATCPSGQVVRYTVADGYRLSGNPDTSFQAVDEQACLLACTNNRLPAPTDGRQAPCRSADYNAQSGQCAISLQATPPAGNRDVEANAGTKHFEKICVDATIGQQCQGPYFLAPQRILIGYAQAVVTASSLAECLQMCVNSRSRFTFDCSSGMFYFADTSNNCILNSETRSTQPEVFAEEKIDKVEYFEPGCANTNRVRRQSPTAGKSKRNRNSLQLNLATFGGWTMCDTALKEHMRFKQCAGLNPNKCQIQKNKCDPSKEDEYDLDLELSLRSPVKKNAGSTVPTPTSTIRPTTTSRTIRSSPLPSTVSKSTPTTTAHRTTTTPSNPSKTTPRPTNKITATTRLVLLQLNTTAAANTSTSSAGAGKISNQFKPGDCVPVTQSDGKRDCQNGMRVMPNGKRQRCRPDKKTCNDKNTKGNNINIENKREGNHFN